MGLASAMRLGLAPLVICVSVALVFEPGLALAEGDEQVVGTEPFADSAVEKGDAAVEEEEYDPLFDEFDEEFEAARAGFPDPLEDTNRRVAGFNSVLDKWLLDPLTKAYGFIFPGPVKRSIRRLFLNLGEPATTFNNLLQLEWKDAGVSTSRFVINSTIGIAGLFDPASAMGLEYHRSDFGQTLALAGTPSGSYLIVPVFGPNNVRDGFGILADFAMHPLTWFLGPTNFLLYSIYGGGQGISVREEALPQLDALREGSIDYYAALRNAFYQNRQAQIWRRREDRRHDWDPD